MEWFSKYGRNYPWRLEKDPFKILIAEIMLQRTRADQVLPVYKMFVQRWQNAKSLVESDASDIAAVFARLGLSWRANLLIQMAGHIQKEYNGKLPDSRDELLALPGVGDYIADATLVFAFHRKRTIVDSNVVRLVTRFFGIVMKGEMRRNREFVKFCQRLSEDLHNDEVKKFNWSILDHSSAICKVTPQCHLCPLTQKCQYFAKRQ